MQLAAIRFSLAVIAFAGVGFFVVSSAWCSVGTVAVGQPVTFSVAADGTTPFTYQWFKNGASLPGATEVVFSISSVQTTDAGNYYAVVSNAAGATTSDNATLTVAAASAPVFTVQPASQTAIAGASVTFTAAASGVPTPTYQWRKNGSSISGATSTSYTITGVATADAGTYTVVASNSAGSITSAGATLVVTTAVSAPVITMQPVSQTVTAGTSVTFTVAASGSPTPTFQWRKNGTSIGGATNASYTIASVASTDAGTYTVVATNSAGSATSNGAILTVNPAASAPVFTTQPVSQTATVGSSVTFTAAASGSPTPSYRWRKNGVNISGATSSSYRIASVTTSSAGTYTVVATNSAGSATSNGAVLTVKSAGTAPSFTVQPMSLTATVGTSVTFTAVASGSPAPTYQWRKNGTNITGATGSSYLIASVASGDAGTYTVVASNSAGSATSNGAVLTVTAGATAPSFVTQPASQTVPAGTSVTFSVNVTGSPVPTLQWQKGGANIAGATGASYTIASVSAGDAGTYAVVATNSAGSATSNSATLTVTAALMAPTITSQPASQTVTVGSPVTFTGAASGSPTPTLQWQKDGVDITGATDPSFAIASVVAGDAGTYTLVATNSAGSAVSNGAVLTVNFAAAAPSFASQPQNQSASAGQNASFTVAATGNPAPTYQWQRLPAASTTWESLNEGGSYQGTTGTTLVVGPITAAMSGDQFRCVIANAAGSATSDAVALIVPGATGALFEFPASIAADSAGNLYVADTSSNTIDKVSSGGIVSTLAGTTGVAGTQDGTGGGALFNQPGGVAVDGAGNVFVADTGNATIRKITPAGTVSTLAGSPATRGSQDGTGSAATFSAPVGLAVDGAGNIYVADAFNATIRRITSAGMVSTLAGIAANRGDADGSGGAARFNYPSGVAVDGAGNVYVADTYNDTIREITAAGVVTTVAGSPGISGATDLAGQSALFNQPCGVAIDAAGNIYVADTGNGTIRQIGPGGVVRTVAGVAGIAGWGDGPGSSALFNQPRGVAVDASGNVFVADTGNGTLRKIAADGTVTTPALAAGANGSTPPPSSGGTTTPASGTDSSSGGAATGTAAASGGGGGAIEPWFLLPLVVLCAAKFVRRRAVERSVRHR
ncbi:MAG TPA: immunoglobulin domain-containing protein [Opitutaceae bacterium]|nr:immunoglobulin domain-containing protein [Opitutaceae bacterium]